MRYDAVGGAPWLGTSRPARAVAAARVDRRSARVGQPPVSRLLDVERIVLRATNLPAGVSLVCLARKP
jgi:hypothetical protein